MNRTEPVDALDDAGFLGPREAGERAVRPSRRPARTSSHVGWDVAAIARSGSVRGRGAAGPGGPRARAGRPGERARASPAHRSVDPSAGASARSRARTADCRSSPRGAGRRTVATARCSSAAGGSGRARRRSGARRSAVQRRRRRDPSRWGRPARRIRAGATRGRPTGSSVSRRKTNDRTRADGRSSHCTSSIATTTGRLAASVRRTWATASETARGSGAPPVSSPRSSARSSARRSGGESSSKALSGTLRQEVAEGRVRHPRFRFGGPRHEHGPARARAPRRRRASHSVVLPIPALPSRTSARRLRGRSGRGIRRSRGAPRRDRRSTGSGCSHPDARERAARTAL